jgi:hypothetical protein
MESAKNVIGEQPKGDYTLRLGDHAAELPAAAGPLKRVLQTESVGAARKLYEDIDKEARSYQQTYKKRGKWFVMLTAVAAIGGAIVLYLPGAEETGEPPGQTAQAREMDRAMPWPIGPTVRRHRMPAKLTSRLLFLFRESLPDGYVWPSLG